MITRFLFALTLLLFASPFLQAQSHIPTFNPKHYICYRSLGSLTIDGKLDEASWQQAAWTDEFMDIEGEHMPKPRFATRAKMLWDEEYLYIAAYMEEPHVWGTLTERDAVIFHDNDFEVFIDPDGDTHFYYEFEMNALNTIWDLMLTSPYRDEKNVVLNAWDIRGIKTGVQVEGTLNNPKDKDKGWSVEIAMPWKVLSEKAASRRKPEAGEYWRINFSRVEWQIDITEEGYQKKINPDNGRPYPEDNWVWTPQEYINMHRPETWGFLAFSDIEVGKGREDFSIPEVEYLKWELRKVYFRQQDYFKTHQKYADQMEMLDLDISSRYNIQIDAQPTYYVASLIDHKTDETWLINEKGKVWRVK
jgi:hypothetical protein